MIAVSNKWREYVKEYDTFHIKGVLTQKNGVGIALTDNDFMIGSVSFSSATSNANSFDIGGCVTGSFQCTLNNNDNKFSAVDFDGAIIALRVGIEYADGTSEYIPKGVYNIDRPTSLGNTIKITAYDDMDKFNRYYTGYRISGEKDIPITLPINSSTLVEYACDTCGVAYEDIWQDLTAKGIDIVIPDFEYTDENTTWRQVLNWILQANGAYAYIDNTGNLIATWYGFRPMTAEIIDGNTLDGGAFWSGGDTAYGGVFDPWFGTEESINGGEWIAGWFLNKVSSSEVDALDVSITGVRVTAFSNDPDTFDFKTVGERGYILTVADNPLILKVAVGADNFSSIADTIYKNLKGLIFRPFNARIWGDPSMEAGDPVTFIDYKGNLHFSYVTNLTYNMGNLTNISCGAESATGQRVEYASESTDVMQGAIQGAYDYLRAKKLSADYITAGTMEGRVVATDFIMEGGSIKVKTDSSVYDVIEMNYDGGSANCKLSLAPALLRMEVGASEARLSRGNADYIMFALWGSGDSYMDSSGAATFSTSVTTPQVINSSRVELKKNIDLIESTIDKVVSADIVSFNLKGESEEDKKHIGLAIGGKYNVPKEIIAVDENGEEKGVDLYAMTSMLWRAVQEQQEQIEILKKELENGNTN